MSDPDKPGETVIVKPGLLFVHDQRNFSLIVELKSGRFRDFTQLDRFRAVTPRDLFVSGNLPIRSEMISTHQKGLVEIVNAEHLSEYLAEFVRVSPAACLVSIDGVIKSHRGTLSDTTLHRELQRFLLEWAGKIGDPLWDESLPTGISPKDRRRRR